MIALNRRFDVVQFQQYFGDTLIGEEKKTALITGADGFLGRHLRAKLIQLGWNVEEWPDDIRQVSLFDLSVDLVFHLAGVTTEEVFSKHISDSYDVNISGTQAVLNYCKKANSKCVFASTSGVYKETNEIKRVDETFEVKPTKAYAITKFIGENLCYLATKDMEVPSTCLRLFNVFGEGQKEPFLVPYVVNRLVKGEYIFLRMPEGVRDFVYVADVVDAIIRAGIHLNEGFSIYNIGSGIGTRVIDFLAIVEEVFERTPQIEIIDSKVSELSTMVSDSSKARKELGWKQRTSLREGLLSMRTSVMGSEVEDDSVTVGRASNRLL